jgi:hypothetical protein
MGLNSRWCRLEDCTESGRYLRLSNLLSVMNLIIGTTLRSRAGVNTRRITSYAISILVSNGARRGNVRKEGYTLFPSVLA